MKAAQLVKYGGKDAVQVDDTPQPQLASGEVLVAVYAAAVNPFDIKVREGLVRDMADLRLPATLGGDVAGVVTKKGDNVTEFNIGQAVYGQANALGGQGSFAEYTPVKAAQLAAKPASLDFDQAAALPLVACSAYQALVDHMELKTGQKILIHGGAGGIGSIAIPLAKYLGAYVATTASGEDIEFVKNLGADEVIDYKQQDFAELDGFDAVYDTIGGDTNSRSYDVLKPRGTLVSMIEKPDDSLVKQHGIKYVAQFTQVTTDRLAAVAKLADEDILKPTIDKVFPLDQAAEALEYLKTSHTRGKVIIEIKNSD